MNTDAKLDEAQKQVAELVTRFNDVAVKAQSELIHESRLRRSFKFNIFQIDKEQYPVSIFLCRIAKSLRCFSSNFQFDIFSMILDGAFEERREHSHGGLTAASLLPTPQQDPPQALFLSKLRTADVFHPLADMAIRNVIMANC